MWVHPLVLAKSMNAVQQAGAADERRARAGRQRSHGERRSRPSEGVEVNMGRIAIRYCVFWISGLHAVRVAARLRRELKTEVDMVRGRYGEFKVLVDGDVVIDGGALAVLGVLPSGREVLNAVRARLAGW
jgi:hypothetical protein